MVPVSRLPLILECLILAGTLAAVWMAVTSGTLPRSYLLSPRAPVPELSK